MKNYITTFICLIFLSCYSQEAEQFITSEFEVAIFPAEYDDILIPTNRFTPTYEQIIIAEKALQEQLEKVNFQLINQYEPPLKNKNLKKYCRQYFGYIDKNGDEILLINCFWKKNKSNYTQFKKGYINVLDGGSYYWNIKYNLSTNILFDLYVNGYG